jgi:hypothetical protein
MKISDFRKAMRPKKYLTRDFVVYQDPKMQAARSEMQAGGVVEREGFYEAGLATSGPNKGKWTIKDVWDPVAKKKGTKVFKTEEAANKFIEKLKYKSDKFYKSRVILDDPKKKKAFLKYANKPGVTTADIRNKFDLSKEEFFNGGLRNIIDKDFASQRKIQPKTVENMLKLHNDKEAMNYIRKGQIVPDEIITKLGIKPYAAATATVRLAQHYGGQDFGFDELNEVRRNSTASQKLFTAMDKFQFGNPYHSNLYNISLELIDDKLGNERGTFAQLKTKARDVLAKNKIKGFDINEIAGVVGSAKSDAAEFSQFIDVMESKLNQEEMASFQSAFSRARENLKNNPKNFNTISKKINKLATNFEDRYNVQLPRIRKAEDVSKYYSPKRLAELKKQGLDIVSASKRAGYTIQMPKGAVTAQEFVKDEKIQKKLFKDLDVDPETREILNRLNNKLSMNPFDAEGLFKDEIAKMKKFGTPAAKFIGGVLGGLIAEVGFEAAFAIPAYSRGVDFDEILSNTIFGLAGAGKTRLEKVVEESGFDPDVVKYADLVNRKKQFIADAGFVEYFGAPGVKSGYAEIFSPGEKSPFEKRVIENAQILDKELDQLKEGSPLEQKFKQAEDKLKERYEKQSEEQRPRKFLKETGQSVIDYFKDEEQRFNRRMNELERLGFKRGGFGKIGRRSFLKLAAGIAAIIGGIRGGVKQLKTPAAKKVLKDAPQGTPDWFAPLVEKLTKEGIDISDKAATIERQTVKELKTPDGTYTLTETPDTGEIIVSVDTGAGVNDFPVEFTMTPNKVTGIADDGTPINEFGEFNIIETRAEGRLMSPDGDYDIEPAEYVTNNLDDAASDWHSVEKFATGKTDEIAQKKKQDGKEFIEKNPGEDIVNRYGDYDPPEPEPDDFYD